MCPSLWPSGIGSHLGRNRLWVRFLAVSDIYPMFIEPTITWVPSGLSGYIWLDTKIVLKKKICKWDTHFELLTFFHDKQVSDERNNKYNNKTWFGWRQMVLTGADVLEYSLTLNGPADPDESQDILCNEMKNTLEIIFLSYKVLSSHLFSIHYCHSI